MADLYELMEKRGVPIERLRHYQAWKKSAKRGEIKTLRHLDEAPPWGGVGARQPYWVPIDMANSMAIRLTGQPVGQGQVKMITPMTEEEMASGTDS